MTGNSKDDGISPYHGLSDDADPVEQLRTVYADWADKYDHDNDHVLGTVSQPNAVALLARHLTSMDAAILDVGCGTGLVGHHLNQHGYTTYDGTDLSEEMLRHASTRGYRNLFPTDATTGIPVGDNSYDAVVCVGVFTHGHWGPEGFDELLRMAKPGGLVVLTVNEGVWETDGYAAKAASMNDSGLWTEIERSRQSYMVNEDVEAWYIVARKP